MVNRLYNRAGSCVGSGCPSRSNFGDRVEIGTQAGNILEGLENAERNTAGLAGLNETITSALAVIAGLKRGRSRLGG